MDYKKNRKNQPDINCILCQQKLPNKPVLKDVRDRNQFVAGKFTVFECPDCLSGTTFPVASDKDLKNFYKSDYQAYQDETGFKNKLFNLGQKLRVNQGALKDIKKLSPGTALDVGCGRGDLGADLIKKGWCVSGLEPDEGAAKIASKRGIKTYCGLLKDRTIDRPSNGFDLIVF